MSTITTEIDSIRELLDRETIAGLIHRLGVILDEQAFDELPQVFVEDGSVATPGGRAQGIEAMRAQAMRNHRPGLRSQHVYHDVLVTVDGDEATARANTIAVFALSDSAPATPGERVVNPSPQFGIGSVYRFGARRTADGWRLTSMAMHPIWELGERP